MEWWGRYIGIPFRDGGRDRSACDCWGLVRLIYRDELGIDLPDGTGYAHVRDGEGISRICDSLLLDWYPIVGKPRPFDVPLFRLAKGCAHVGVMIDGVRMVHAAQGKDSCVEPCFHLGHPTFYRHREIG
ncbi:MAG TPA: NlpC/P60 family protein [Methylococcus sp.]|nr:NlpC/P60 family protein [Methylococcus sp.]